MFVDLCWWANERDKDLINVASLQLTDQQPFMEIVQLWQVHVWLLLGHMCLVLIRSGIINPVVGSKEKCWSPNGHLFSLTLSYLDAEPEEKESSLLGLSTSSFRWHFRWHFHTERETPTKGESEWNEHFVKLHTSKRRWQYYCKHYARFSVSLTGIVNRLSLKGE